MNGMELDVEAAYRQIEELEAQAATCRSELREERRRRAGDAATSPTSAPSPVASPTPPAFVSRMSPHKLARGLRRVARGMLSRVRRVLPGMSRPKASESAAMTDLALDSQTASQRRALYVRPERIAVYTVLFGPYDTVREPKLVPSNVDYYLITDQQLPPGSAWQPLDASVVPEELRGDPIASNRWCKMHPHVLFPGYEYSVYVDANIWVFSDLTPVCATLDDFPVAMFRHKRRDCVYDEVQACIEQHKDDPAALRAHEALIRSHGIPRHWGLLEASVIARKHAEPLCVSLMESWWREFRANSRRDQISLIDCLWQAGIEPSRIGTLGANLTGCDLFVQVGHGEGSRQ